MFIYSISLQGLAFPSVFFTALSMKNRIARYIVTTEMCFTIIQWHVWSDKEMLSEGFHYGLATVFRIRVTIGWSVGSISGFVLSCLSFLCAKPSLSQINADTFNCSVRHCSYALCLPFSRPRKEWAQMWMKVHEVYLCVVCLSYGHRLKHMLADVHVHAHARTHTLVSKTHATRRYLIPLV